MAARPSARPEVVIDPDAGIPDLIRRLVDDSKRLAQDEVALARLEVRARAHDATRGGIWLGVAFGAAIVALVALTVCLAALVGRALGHYWAGTLIVAVLELAVGAFVALRGLRRLKRAQVSLPATREEARNTARWAKGVRSRVAADVRGARRAAAGATLDPSLGHVEIPIVRRD